MIPYLSAAELDDVLSRFAADDTVRFVRSRPHNKGEIRTVAEMGMAEFVAMVRMAHQQGHQPGGDLRVTVPGLGKVLCGHHDGVYWLEDPPPEPG